MITVNTKPLVSVRETRDDLADQLYRQLKEAIVIGQYRPGDTLPTIEHWCEQLKLAPKTVHTAIRQLGREGLLQSNRAAGTVVCEPPRQAVMDIGELYLTPTIEQMLRLSLTKAETQQIVAKVLESFYAPRQGDRRKIVRTAQLLGQDDRRSAERRKTTKKAPVRVAERAAT